MIPDLNEEFLKPFRNRLRWKMVPNTFQNNQKHDTK